MKQQRRKKRIFTFLLALFMVFSQVMGSVGMTVGAEGIEEGSEQNTAIIRPQKGSEIYNGERNLTWLFVGETQSFFVDVSNLQLDGEYTVEWDFGEEDIIQSGGEFSDSEVKKYVSYEVSKDGHGITITGIEKSRRLRAEAVIKVQGEEVARTYLLFDVRDEIYDYQFPMGDDIVLLPYWKFDINKYNNCYVANPEYPYGENLGFEIIDFTVMNAEDEESEHDVVTYWPWDGENGWSFQMESYGHAIGTITYETIDGEEATKTFNIWGGSDIYGIDAWTNTEEWKVLPGESIQVTPKVWLDCYYEDEGHFSGDTSDVTLEWTWGANDRNYEEAFEVSLDESNILQITALGDSAERALQLQLRAYVLDENEEKQEVAYHEWWVESRWGYSQIQLMEEVNTDLEVGAETTFVPELWEYVHTEEGNESYHITENLKFGVDFDTNAFQITDAEGKVLSDEDRIGVVPFTLKKLQNCDTDVQLFALQLTKDGEWQETARKNRHFFEQDYSVYFEDLRGGNHTWLFASEKNPEENEEYVLTLNTGNLPNQSDYEIRWQVGYYNDEDEFFPLENPENAYQVSEDGNSITLYAGELRNKLKEMLGREEDDTSELWTSVEIEVYVGEEKVYQTGTGVGIKEIQSEIRLPEGITMLPGWEYEMDKTVEYYVENPEYFQGENIDVEILGVTVENAKDEGAENPVATSRAWEDEDGWTIEMKSFGHAIATVTYLGIDGKEATHTFDVWGCDAVYDVYAETSIDGWSLLPGESFEVFPKVNAEYYSEEEGYDWEDDLQNVVFEWNCGMNDTNWQEAFQVSVEEETGVLTLQGLPVSEERWIQLQLRAYLPDEDGELQEIGYNEWWVVNVLSDYRISFSEINTELKLGEETILEPELWHHLYSKKGNRSEKIEGNFRWEVDFQEDMLQITDADGVILTNENNTGTAPFTIKRVKVGDLNVSLHAFIPEENGGWYHCASRDWYFTTSDCSIWFDDLRGDGYSWIFASADNASENEDYTLNLNMENWEGVSKDFYDIQWRIGYWEDDGEFYTLEEEAGAYEIGEDGTSITLHSGEVRSQFMELMGKNEEDNPYIWFEVEAYVFVDGEEINMANTGIEVLQPSYWMEDYHGLYQVANDMVIHDSMVYENGKVSCFVQNKEYPQGEYFFFDIIDLTADYLGEEGELAVSIHHDAKENGWRVVGERCGGVWINYHVQHEEFGEFTFGKELYVKEEVYRFAAWNEQDTNHLLKGHSIDILLEGARFFYDETDKEVTGEVMDLEDCYFEVMNHSEGLITIGDMERDRFTITATKNWSGAVYFEVHLSLAETMEHQTSQELMLWITDCYYQVFAEDVIAAPGEKVEIPAVLKKFDLDHPDGIVMEDAVYHLEHFGSEKIVFDEMGTGITVAEDAATVAELPKEAWVRCIVEMYDEQENHICEEREVCVLICAHDWEEKSCIEATCTREGLATYQCKKCKFQKTEKIPEKDHTQGQWNIIQEASCTEGGKKEQKCSVCQTLLKTEGIPANGHIQGEWKTVQEASCAETGKKEQKCSVCQTLLKIENIEKLTTHTWDTGEITKAPTATKKGIKTYTCTVCNVTKTEDVKAKGTQKKGKTFVFGGATYKITKSGLKNGEVTFVKISTKSKNITVPATIRLDGITYKVTAIEKNAFKGNAKVTKIVIGKNVAKIGANVFSGCKKLKDLVIQTTKLNSNGLAKNIFKTIRKSVQVKVPKKSLKVYKKLFKSKGLNKKVKVIK